MIEHVVSQIPYPMPTLLVARFASLGVDQPKPLLPKAKKMLYIVPSAVAGIGLLARHLPAPFTCDHHPERASVHGTALFVRDRDPQEVEGILVSVLVFGSLHDNIIPTLQMNIAHTSFVSGLGRDLCYIWLRWLTE
jgi:hypothetical protein